MNSAAWLEATNITTKEPELTAAGLPETEVVRKPQDFDKAEVSIHTSDITEHTRGMYQAYTRLPKLLLPTFDSQPLQWQSFWDAFTSAADFNPGVKSWTIYEPNYKVMQPLWLVAFN